MGTETMTDQEIILNALHDARDILGDYVDPKPHHCEDAIHRLLRVLDRDEVVEALDRLDRRKAFKLISIT
jgi:hypothetical protein